MSEPKKAETEEATAQEPEAKQAAVEVDAAIDETELESVAGGGFVLGGPGPTPGF